MLENLGDENLRLMMLDKFKVVIGQLISDTWEAFEVSFDSLTNSSNETTQSKRGLIVESTIQKALFN